MFQLFNVNIATEILKIGFNTDIVDEGMKIFVGDRHPKIIYFLVYTFILHSRVYNRLKSLS